jgi:hypothetical protein
MIVRGCENSEIYGKLQFSMAITVIAKGTKGGRMLVAVILGGYSLEHVLRLSKSINVSGTTVNILLLWNQDAC